MSHSKLQGFFFIVFLKKSEYSLKSRTVGQFNFNGHGMNQWDGLGMNLEDEYGVVI